MPRLFLLLAPVIVAAMISHATAQVALRPLWVQRADDSSERQRALLRCFQAAPWVDRDGQLDRCIAAAPK